MALFSPLLDGLLVISRSLRNQTSELFHGTAVDTALLWSISTPDPVAPDLPHAPSSGRAGPGPGPNAEAGASRSAAGAEDADPASSSLLRVTSPRSRIPCGASPNELLCSDARAGVAAAALLWGAASGTSTPSSPSSSANAGCGSSNISSSKFSASSCATAGRAPRSG